MKKLTLILVFLLILSAGCSKQNTETSKEEGSVASTSQVSDSKNDDSSLEEQKDTEEQDVQNFAKEFASKCIDIWDISLGGENEEIQKKLEEQGLGKYYDYYDGIHDEFRNFITEISPARKLYDEGYTILGENYRSMRNTIQFKKLHDIEASTPTRKTSDQWYTDVTFTFNALNINENAEITLEGSMGLNIVKIDGEMKIDYKFGDEGSHINCSYTQLEYIE